MGRLLITGGNGRLARAVARELSGAAELRVVDGAFAAPAPAADARTGDLRDPRFAAAAADGVDAVLHLAPLSPPDDEQEALDLATRGTYTLLCAALDAGARRIILGSTLDLFESLPARWRVSERWLPRPSTSPAQLGPWLAELSARELTRQTEALGICLRFGALVDSGEAAAQPYDPRWLHIEDAVAGVRQALAFAPPDGERRGGWRVFHITAAGQRAKVRLADAGGAAFGYQPRHDFQKRWPEQESPAEPAPPPAAAPAPRPIRNVVIFGAGGPLAAAAARELAPTYCLRLTDARPIPDLAVAKPQSEGAPLPAVLPAPHTWQVVDVRDPAAVRAACEGMDAIVNCTVVRPDPVEAFRVNTLGAYNVLRAAVACGIRRVVQTGPFQFAHDDPTGYAWDARVPDDAPPRPGRQIYFHTKFLGQEIARVFAERHALEVPVLLFCQFFNPANVAELVPFAVSWQDGALAIRRALEAPSLPSPYEVLSITIDLPHARFSNRRAREVLGWAPRDTMEELW